MSIIFISYRRDDSAPYAGRLYDRLTARFGKGQVFMDIDHIEPGEDFVEVINRKVSACETAVVLIGKAWLSATDGEGRRRLDDPEDFVRLEVAAALQRKVRVVPVLVGGAAMPRMQQLPEPLALLSRRNAIEISDSHFHADVDRLIGALERSAVPSAPGTGDTLPYQGFAPEDAEAARVKAPVSSPSIPHPATPPAVPLSAVETAPTPANSGTAEPPPQVASAPDRAVAEVAPKSPPSSRGAAFEIGYKAARASRASAGLIPGKGRQVALAGAVLGAVVVAFFAPRWSGGPASSEPVASESQHSSPSEVKPADAVTQPAAAPAAPSVSTAALLDDVRETPPLIEPELTKGSSPGLHKELVARAVAGSAEAQFELGVEYENGSIVVSKNLDKAAKWYGLAAAQGYPLAKQGLDDVESLVLRGDKAQDSRMVGRWLARSSAYQKILDEQAKEAIKRIRG